MQSKVVNLGTLSTPKWSSPEASVLVTEDLEIRYSVPLVKYSQIYQGNTFIELEISEPMTLGISVDLSGTNGLWEWSARSNFLANNIQGKELGWNIGYMDGTDQVYYYYKQSSLLTIDLLPGKYIYNVMPQYRGIGEEDTIIFDIDIDVSVHTFNNFDNTVKFSVLDEAVLIDEKDKLYNSLDGDDRVTLGTAAQIAQYGLSTVFFAGSGHDIIVGRDADDRILGEDGNDKLTGGGGNDTLVGGSDNDELNALDGRHTHDWLDGGAGQDTFLVDAGDEIRAVEVGETVTFGSGALLGRTLFKYENGRLSAYAYDTNLRVVGQITVVDGFSTTEIGNFKFGLGNAFSFSRTAPPANLTASEAILLRPEEARQSVAEVVMRVLDDVGKAAIDDLLDKLLGKGVGVIDAFLGRHAVNAAKELRALGYTVDGGVDLADFATDMSKMVQDATKGRLTNTEIAGKLILAVHDLINPAASTTKAVAEGVPRIGTAIFTAVMQNVVERLFSPLIEMGKFLEKNGSLPSSPSSGPDMLIFDATSSFRSSGTGDDTVVIAASAKASISGGSGQDTIALAGSGDRLINLSAEQAVLPNGRTITVTGFENAQGANGKDVLRGDDLANYLSGEGGHDRLDGGGRNDTLTGGGGNDRLKGGAGNDVMIGGNGVDTADYSGKTAVRVNLGLTEAQATGAGRDVLSGIENVIAGSARDRLIGNIEANVLNGDAGHDTLAGQAGNDRLIGGEGNDSLIGGSGNDQLIGGTGSDRMAGGAGNDIYWVDRPGDAVTEKVAGGIDQLSASISINLDRSGGVYVNVENVVLQGVHNLNASGSAQDNQLVGNRGDNILSGRTGNDVLVGGAGEDSFLFLKTFDEDTISDFQDNIDTIRLPKLGIASFAEARRLATQDGTDVEFDFGNGDVLTIRNTTIDALANDVVFV